MKKSELKALIREALDEAYGSSFRVPKEQEELAKKFFVALYSYVKKHGEQKHIYANPKISPHGGWQATRWTYKGAIAADESRHYGRVVYGKNVEACMDRKGNMIFPSGTLDDLKELLISVIPDVAKKPVNEASEAEKKLIAFKNDKDG